MLPPGRAGGCPPAPPQTRTSPIRAYGSSAYGFAACPALSVGLSERAWATSECRRVAPARFRYRRLLPSLLPGSWGLVRRLSVGTIKQIRLPPALLPPLGSSPCGAIPWVGLTVSLREAGRPTASGPGCCSAVSSFPAFGPKDALGSPKFPANPSDLRCALGPRSALGARSLGGAQAWPPQLLRRRHQPVMTFGALSHRFNHRCLRFVPSSRTTTQNSLPVADRPFRVGFSMPTEFVRRVSHLHAFLSPRAYLGAKQVSL